MFGCISNYSLQYYPTYLSSCYGIYPTIPSFSLSVKLTSVVTAPIPLPSVTIAPILPLSIDTAPIPSPSAVPPPTQSPSSKVMS